MLVLCLSFSIVLLDQVTKYLIPRILPHGQLTIIPDVFDLRFVQNTGAAWGMMQGFNQWLVVVSVIVLALMIVFRRSWLTHSLAHRVSLGLLLAGVIGNLLDRIRLGYVVDFLDFHWGVHHFPAFNVADSAICVGVGLYMLTQFAPSGPSEAASKIVSAKPKS